MKRVLAASVLLAGALSAAPASAQHQHKTVLSQQHGQWAVRCEQDRLTDKVTCRAQSVTRYAGYGRVGALVIFVSTLDDKTVLLLFGTGRNRMGRSAFRVDSNPPIQRDCDMNCVFIAHDSADLLAQMASGKTLLVRTREQTTDITVSLSGLRAALTTLDAAVARFYLR